jgi:putative NIF3 family GTP cyclohydrolase 1 type 2
MREAHSYEEPAFDIYPLKPRPVRGMGRVGRFAKPMTLGALAKKLGSATRAGNVQLVGKPGARVEQAVVVAGSAGSLPFRVPLTERHVVVAGEIHHHDALAYARAGCAAIALGHWSSERPVLTSLAQRLNKQLGVATMVSAADSDPFAA